MEQLLHRFEVSLQQSLVETTGRGHFKGMMHENREKTNNWPRWEFGHFSDGHEKKQPVKEAGCSRQGGRGQAHQMLSREPAGGYPESPSLLSSRGNCF